MLHLPILRWGQPYESLDVADLVHFQTGERIAHISQANGGIIQRDLRRSHEARRALRQIPARDLVARCQSAAELFESARLPLGNGHQTPNEFVSCQSATTGMPEHLCRENLAKVSFVLAHMGDILDALTRGLDLTVFSRGYGIEDRGVVISYRPQSPVLGAVLPSNSPGVHTLWLPAVALQIGLALKPGSAEPWTPYRVASALIAAGIPSAAIGVYPGGHDVAQALISACRRTMVFGNQQTVEQYRGNPAVQVHGPGVSKILLGDDAVDDWPEYVDLMEESVLSNGGRSCVNCSGVWASRHTREIAAAIAERLGPIDVRPPDDPAARLAAFPQVEVAEGVWSMVQADLRTAGVTDMTAAYGPRLVRRERCAYLRPVVAWCERPDSDATHREYMFPFVSVVSCPQEQMLCQIGPTLVASAITRDEPFIEQLGECTDIDRLNIGPIPTHRLNWLQPHEGNIIDFLYRSRAYQMTDEHLAGVTSARRQPLPTPPYATF